MKTDESQESYLEFRELVRKHAEEIIATRPAKSLIKYHYVQCYLSKERFLEEFPTVIAREHLLSRLRITDLAKKNAQPIIQTQLDAIPIVDILGIPSPD